MAFLGGSLEEDQSHGLCEQVAQAIHTCQTERIPLALLSYLHVWQKKNEY